MNKFHKITFITACFIIFMIAVSCALNIASPASMRFSAQVTIIDTTAAGLDSLVSGANVTMQSITYGEIYEGKTNALGQALFHGLLPDRYNILASGNRVDLTEIIIINGQLQDTSLFIENNDTLDLSIIAQTSR
ncbi:MAG: carboxypeptidase-like regulatory domain-containing protein, partial [Candidatus Marinimicrobia bacterium]|nr:carboxypeptidase-like regulatory domain-containing protein [Candidatus Neomarinimicrobiota bacterium]